MSIRCLFYLAMGRALHDGEKHTRPRAAWPLPSALLRVCGVRPVFLTILPLMLLSFLVASLHSDQRFSRLMAALLYTLFSMGCAYALQWGHGQYPVLWTTWFLAALKLTNPGLDPALELSWAVAVARGSTLYLFLSAGLAKACVPCRPADYMQPETMASLMINQHGQPRFNPLFPSLTLTVASSRPFLSLTLWLTMILELVIWPATLLCIPTLSFFCAFISMVFHTGIWWSFSSTAGPMFYQLSGLYALGLCSVELVPFSAPWLLCASLGLSPAIYLGIYGHPFILGEKWPCTNCALFPWSHWQVQYATKYFKSSPAMIDDQAIPKLVLSSQKLTTEQLQGLPVVTRGQGTTLQAQKPEQTLLHSAYGNIWMWTKVYPPVVHALNSHLSPSGREHQTGRVGQKESQLSKEVAADLNSLLAIAVEVQAWLQHEHPLYECHTDRPLLYAYIVELESSTASTAAIVRKVYDTEVTNYTKSRQSL